VPLASTIPAKSSGFSLLELIIVLVIIGVVVAAVTISVGDGRGDKLNLEARRLAARLSLARDEAILTNQEYGLGITKEGYRFLVLEEGNWQEIEAFGERQLVQQDLPEGMEIQLSVEGLFAQFQQQNTLNKLFTDYDENAETEQQTTTDSEQLDKGLRPQIYLMSSGELNPFTLVIGYEDQSPLYYQLQASYDGKISLTGPIEQSLTSALGAIK